MITVDLITGFLGSGKTTFIQKYARYLMDQHIRICILENDLGAINVDRVLLREALGEDCGIEMIVGGDGFEAHQRRMRTKLIAMAMSGYERVIVEPSGIFDVDELFDLLYEEPLDSWYEMGNVITIVDAGLSDTLSQETGYLMTSQTACAGRIVLSKTQSQPVVHIQPVISMLDALMEQYKCPRRFNEGDILAKDWDDLTAGDLAALSSCGYRHADHIRLPVAREGHYSSLFCFDEELSERDLNRVMDQIFRDPACGHIFRIKGFMRVDGRDWTRINATGEMVELSPCDEAQDVLIVIGESLDKERLRRYLPVR